MKKIFTIIAIASLTIFFSGCESKLDIEQRGVISESAYYKTDADAESSIAYVYRLWKEALFSSANVFSHMTPDCYAGGGIRNDNVQYEQANDFRYTIENTNFSNYFKKMYTMIYNCNNILEKYEDDSETKLRIKAEAKVLRAYANFMLVTLWGTPYYVDHVLPVSETQLANAESPQIFWTSIENDLKDAINSGKLPSKTGIDDKVTGIRITKEYAQAYLGKAYLWQEKWNEAAAMLQNVINSELYGLVDDISIMFSSKGDYCKEYLAEAVALNDPIQWNKQDGLSGMAFVWKWSNSIKLNQNQSEWPYSTAGGYGFFNPTGTFVDLVRSVEGESGKRYKQYFITWDYMVSHYGATATRNHFFNEGIFQTKLLTRKGDDFSSTSSNGWFYTHQNWPHMRYAEVLLMAAEAYLQSNDMSRAILYFNQVRSRADAPTVSILDINTILEERRIELWGESPVIFQDIQRYRLGEALCKDQFAKYPVYTLLAPYADNPQVVWHDNEYSDYGFKEKHYLLPYSTNELRSNPNLKQNPGW